MCAAIRLTWLDLTWSWVYFSTAVGVSGTWVGSRWLECLTPNPHASWFSGSMLPRLHIFMSSVLTHSDQVFLGLPLPGARNRHTCDGVYAWRGALEFSIFCCIFLRTTPKILFMIWKWFLIYKACLYLDCSVYRISQKPLRGRWQIWLMNQLCYVNFLLRSCLYLDGSIYRISQKPLRGRWQIWLMNQLCYVNFLLRSSLSTCLGVLMIGDSLNL